MYGIKGSWAGQTFALATSNDSGGRKSRNRCSKEERKAMAESFIKRYQTSNDGKFPSISLTHKEVGGSFYTVREIVREIIQENKVLGPPSLSSEEQKYDSIAASYPLGSISVEPQGLLFQTENELNVISNDQEKESLELTLDDNGNYTNHHDLDSIQRSTEDHANEIVEGHNELACKNSASESGRFVNVIQTPEICEQSGNSVVQGLPLSKTFEKDGELELIGACKAKLTLPTEEVVVETFPLRPVIQETDNVGSPSTDFGNFNGNFKDLETKQVEFINGSASTENTDSPGRTSDLEVNHTKKALATPDLLTIKKDCRTLHDFADRISSHSDLSPKTDEHSRNMDDIQTNISPKGTTYVENSNGTSSNKANKETPSMVANRNGIRRDDKAMKGSSPTLARINLESWEGASKKPSKQESNPLLAFFKVFVDVFVKFWSE